MTIGRFEGSNHITLECGCEHINSAIIKSTYERYDYKDYKHYATEVGVPGQLKAAFKTAMLGRDGLKS